MPPTGKELYQRCITSIGKAHGATARVQERVADILTKSGSTSIFPSNGIFSYSSLEFTNKVKLSGEIGARTKVISNQEIENGGTLTTSYGTEAKVTCKPACPQSKLSSEQLASSQYNYPSPSPNPYAESQASNNNANMTISSGSINAKRELVLASAGTITIPAGTYNLCKISFSGEMTIKYTPPVKLYVDSPERKTGVPASNCSSGTGQVEMTNKIHWKAADLQIYVWGNPAVSPPTSSSTTFKFNGAVGGPLYAQIYAPYSAVSITNTLNMVGAMAGGWVKMTNQVEVTGEGGGSSSESSGAKTGAQFYATSYHVCPPTYSGEDAASGCY